MPPFRRTRSSGVSASRSLRYGRPCDDWRPRGLVSYRGHRGATVSELSEEAAELYLLWAAARAARADARRAERGEVRRPPSLSRELHEVIAPACGPAFLAGHLRSLWRENPVPADTPLLHDHDNAEVFLREHEDLPAALEAHDRDAAERVMRLHLQHSAARGATFET